VNLSKLAIHRPVTTTMIYLAVAFLGIIGFLRLPVDLLPDISFPTLSVTTAYQGAGPREVEREVTTLLENALSTVPGVTQISSSSTEGRSGISLRFAWGTNLDLAANEVREAIDRIRNRLPDGADSPRVAKFDPNLFPIVLLGIEGRGDLNALRDLAENEYRPRFEQIDGVAAVDVRGARAREIHVDLNRQRLEALRISDREITAALQSESVAAPGGDVRVGSQRRVVRTVGRFASVEEIAQTVVATREGVPVRLADVATVEDTVADASSLVRINGQPGLLIAISKQSGTNTVAVAGRVIRVAEQLSEQFPQARLVTVNDGSRFIRRSIDNLRAAALLGAVLTVAVLLFFLRNVSSTLIISTAIPTSILATFLLMYMGGFTLNLMTFGGLALAVGMLVDNAIVVLENIFRHREEGRPPKLAAEEATNEVGTAVMASTLTTVAVFLPLFFTTGISSVMFRPLAYMVTFALMCSLLVALTLIPSFAARALVMGHGTGALGRIAAAVEAGFVRVEDGYRRLLVRVLRAPVVAAGLAVVLMAGAWLALPRIGRETFPSADERGFFLNIQLPRGTTLDVTDAMARRIERMLIEDTPGTAGVLSLVGSTFNATGTHFVTFRVGLAPGAPSTQRVIASLRPRIQVPGSTFRFTPFNSLFIFRSPEPISIDLRGFDLEVGNAQARRLRGVLETVPGVSDVQVSREESAEEFTVTVDPVKAAAFGATAGQVASSVRTYIGGTTATLFRSGGEDIDVVVRLREADRTTPDRIADVPVSTPRGIVPLKQLARIDGTPGPTQIQRRNRERIITLSANITGREVSSTLRDVRQAVLAERLPAGFSVAFSGEFEEQQESFAQISAGFLMSLVLVYMVMAAQFERLFEPLLIMAAVPFALVGVVGALVLTGTTLNVQSGLGAIVLVGVAVNNAIVLMSYTLQLRDEGTPLLEALARAGQRRLRPILMTTLTTSFGLAPLAFGRGPGSELQSPLALAIIGGLATSTIASLILIPASYVAVDRAFRWVRNRREVPLGAAEPSEGNM
jgi:HAE1 family hydrophobic/amphiphilic exporter-1